jgi:hypothetical protein
MNYFDLESCKTEIFTCSGIAFAKQVKNLDIIKYICGKLQIDYKIALYSNTQDYNLTLQESLDFGDLEMLKIAQKELNEIYPNSPYDNLNDDALYHAIRLNDLVGVKHIYRSNENYAVPFYKKASIILSSVKNAIKVGIKMSDKLGIESWKRNIESDFSVL